MKHGKDGVQIPLLATYILVPHHHFMLVAFWCHVTTSLLCHTQAHTQAHTHTRTHTPTHTRTHTHMHMHTHTHTNTYTHAHTRTNAHTHARTHTYTHAHTHADTHTRTTNTLLFTYPHNDLVLFPCVLHDNVCQTVGGLHVPYPRAPCRS